MLFSKTELENLREFRKSHILLPALDSILPKEISASEFELGTTPNSYFEYDALELSKSLDAMCEDITEEDVEEWINNGVPSFNKSNMVVKRTSQTVNPSLRRNNFIEILQKGFRQETLSPYELDLITNFRNQVSQAVANGYERLATDFTNNIQSSVQRYLSTQEQDAANSILKAQELQFLDDHLKTIVLQSMEDIVWSDQARGLEFIN